uniref:Uncharacterized protein n=2 Tax=Aegilops tauschii subsp. strangulata TaxID=200361 RepID=A0A452YSD3_AEGTS
MGTRAATSAPVAAVSSVLFGRSLPQTPLPTRAHCWGFPPWTRRTTSAAWRSSSGCFLERSREMGSSPTAGAAVLPDGLLPAVLGCISWWWQGFIERSCKYREQGFYVEQFDRLLPKRDGKQWNLRHAHKSMEPMHGADNNDGQDRGEGAAVARQHSSNDGSDDDGDIGDPFLTDRFGNLTSWRLSDLEAAAENHLEDGESETEVEEKKYSKKEMLKRDADRKKQYMAYALQKYNNDEDLAGVCLLSI